MRAPKGRKPIRKYEAPTPSARAWAAASLMGLGLAPIPGMTRTTTMTLTFLDVDITSKCFSIDVGNFPLSAMAIKVCERIAARLYRTFRFKTCSLLSAAVCNTCVGQGCWINTSPQLRQASFTYVGRLKHNYQNNF